MKRINQLLNIILLGVGLGLAQGASAQPAGIAIGPGETPAFESEAQPFALAPLIGGGEALFYIVTDSPTISADASAGIWLKYLPLNGSLPTGLIGPAVNGGVKLGLFEFMVVGEGPAWRDWHESILTPGWEWVTGALADGASEISLPLIFKDMEAVAIPGLDFTINGPDIAFTFDPLEPGTQIVILKLLECTDSEICFEEGGVRIAEYPSTSVPEPATLALLGLGLAGLGFSRRKQ